MNMQTDPSNKNTFSRRQFLTAAGGITFAVAAGAVGFRQLTKTANAASDLPGHELTAWVKLNRDGQITFFNPASEMGQGSMTALAVIFAEEMDVDWVNVRIEMAPVEPDTYGLQWSGELGGPMMTVGSRTIRGYFKALRHAGAQARHALLRQAAQHWEVDISELRTEPGEVIRQSDGQKLSYGQLADQIALAGGIEELPEIPESEWKKPEDFRLIGKDVQRVDIPEKVQGTARFAMDVHLPNMAYGVVARSPVNGAKPSLQNTDEIRQMDGVIELVEMEHGIGVVAERFEQAIKAKQKLQIKWSDAQAKGYDSIAAFDKYQKLARQYKAESRMISEEGNFAGALQSAGKRYDLEYRNDFLYHAQMEPLNAVVSVAPDKKSAEVWMGSQSPDGARNAVAKTLDIGFAQVTFHSCYLGGGFGRRSMTGYVEEATLMSAAVARPVKAIWTREDDVQYGAYRPISLQRMQAGVG